MLLRLGTLATASVLLATLPACLSPPPAVATTAPNAAARDQGPTKQAPAYAVDSQAPVGVCETKGDPLPTIVERAAGIR